MHGDYFEIIDKLGSSERASAQDWCNGAGWYYMWCDA